MYYSRHPVSQVWAGGSWLFHGQYIVSTSNRDHNLEWTDVTSGQDTSDKIKSGGYGIDSRERKNKDIN